jgi:hypothetical protein
MRRFGPTTAQICAVENWLTGAGLSVTKVADEVGGFVQVHGSVAATAKAFGVTFGTFRGPDGKADRAPEQAASAPASVAADVLTVSGLDTATHLMKPQDTLPPPQQNYWVAGPCSTYYGQQVATSEPKAYGKSQPWNNCGYTPRQIRGAYGVSKSGMTGKGQTVAVVDAYASPTMLADANQYAKVTGDKPFWPGQYTQDLLGGTNGWAYTAANQCGAAGWYGEESLDVESVHGQAPDANVVYVGAVSCTDADLGNALALIVNKHLGCAAADYAGAGRCARISAAATPPYAAAARSASRSGSNSYSCGPTVSSTSTAIRLPSWTARSTGSPHAVAARNPQRNASPAPVGSTSFASGTGPIRTGSAPACSTRAPAGPSVITRTWTRSRISADDQPVLLSITASSYSLQNMYPAPSMSERMLSPSRKATCCEKSAAKGMPAARQSAVYRCIAAGSPAPISTRSTPLAAASDAMSISLSSLIAPG